MQSSGFSSTPTTTLLLLTLIVLSLLSTLTSTKHHLPLSPHPHLYPYLQVHRLLLHQVAYTSSTDLLFSTILLYHLRPLERIFGTRKFASLVLVTAFWEGVVLTPSLVGGVLGPLTWGRWGYIPAGPTGLLFAMLAIWAEDVPALWRWSLVLSPARRPPGSRRVRTTAAAEAGRGAREGGKAGWWSITFTSKVPTYLLALQLSLVQFPYTLVPAGVGYLFGSAWAADLLPFRMSGWRIPRWVVGEAPVPVPMWIPFFGGGKGRRQGDGAVERERERYESLRRRLEVEEGVWGRDGERDGDGDGMRQVANAEGGRGGEEEERRRRRPMGVQIADYFRGVF